MLLDLVYPAQGCVGRLLQTQMTSARRTGKAPTYTSSAAGNVYVNNAISGWRGYCILADGKRKPRRRTVAREADMKSSKTRGTERYPDEHQCRRWLPFQHFYLLDWISGMAQEIATVTFLEKATLRRIPGYL